MKTIVKILIVLVVIGCIYYRKEIPWRVFGQEIKNKPIQSVIFLLIIIGILNSCGKDSETVLDTETTMIENDDEIVIENNLMEEDASEEPVGSTKYVIWCMKKQGVSDLNKFAKMAEEYLEIAEKQDDEKDLKTVPNIFGYYYTLTSESSDYIYSGGLKDNRPSGFGVLKSWVGTIKYCGNFDDGRYDGMGVLYDEGISYIGDFSNGQKDGEGVSFIYPQPGATASTLQNIVNESNDMGMALGEHKNGKISGDVKLYISGVLRYEGKMKNGQMNGKGTLYFPDGRQIKYKGEWKKGKYDGKGKLYDENGNLIYSGKWDNGDYAN